MTAILPFKLKRYPVTRNQALGWVSQHYPEFPRMCKTVASDNLFYGWRFVKGLDNVIYFANCIDQGITQEEIKQ